MRLRNVSKHKTELNRQRRAENLLEVKAFCEAVGLEYRFMNGDWQVRIEEVFDVYPTNKKFCWLATGEWGIYDDFEELGKIMVDRMLYN